MERSSARFRNDLSLKVARYSGMCKDLSEDNARGKEAVRGLKEEVARLERERNELAHRLQRTAAGGQEAGGRAGGGGGGEASTSTAADADEPEDTRALQKTVERLRRDAKEKDCVIMGLAARLERAHAKLASSAAESKSSRELGGGAGGGNMLQAPPPSNHVAGLSGQHSAMVVKSLSSQLSAERLARNAALRLVEKGRAESDAREKALQKKIEDLEGELRAAIWSRQGGGAS